MAAHKINTSAVVEVPDKEMVEWLMKYGGLENPPEGKRWVMGEVDGGAGATRFYLDLKNRKKAAT